jgi:putative hydrolase of HD superfamily
VARSREMSEPTRLEQQLQFLAEADKLKDVLRRTLVVQSRRRENSAEHSWHLALMVLIFAHDDPKVDMLKALKLVLVHDLVEIDAGDVFLYDASLRAAKAKSEEAAAERIFNLLPAEQAREMRALRDEFEAGVSGEAKLANAIDRLQPLLQNLQTEGATWRQHGITPRQVLERNQVIGVALPGVWEEMVRRIGEAEEMGYFVPYPEAMKQ